MTMAIAMAARNALPSFSREEEFWQRRRIVGLSLKVLGFGFVLAKRPRT